MTRLPIDFTDHVFCYTPSWGLRQDLAAFSRHVYPEWHGKRMLYLQVGVDEGMVAVWMFQHVLTHSESRAVLVCEPSAGARAQRARERAGHNLSAWKERHTILYGNRSIHIMERGQIDFCFVNGSWGGSEATKLLKPNGWLIVNDGRKVEGLERIWEDGRCEGYRVNGEP